MKIVKREKGGGRKKSIEVIEGIDEAFLRVVDRNIAGSPMNESERWTHLTRQLSSRFTLLRRTNKN